MEVVRAKMHGVSETMGRLEWNGRPMIPTPTINSAPGATQDSLMKLIFERLEKMSKSQGPSGGEPAEGRQVA